MSRTMRQSITDGLHEIMTTHSDAIMIGEALDTRGGASQITYGFLEKYGFQRVVETPISENALVGMALGAAVADLKVVAEVYSADFLFCAGSEVVNDIAKWRYQHHWEKPLHLVLRMPSGSAGSWSGPEHTQSIEGLLNNVPGIRVVVPSNAQDARRALVEAVSIGDPVVFLEHRALYDAPPLSIASEVEADEREPVLNGRIVREGKDVTVVAWGAMQRAAREAAELLEGDGFSVEIVDPVTVKPLNHSLIHQSLAKTRRLLVVDEGPRTGSVAAEIVVRALEDAPHPPEAFKRLTFPDVHHPFDPRLERSLLPSTDDIVAAVKSLARDH